MNLADNPPSDWYQEKDPYGYGINNMFFLNAQQELMVYRYNGHSSQTIYSYDTLKAKNTGNPLSGAKSTDQYTGAQDHTLSHARTIAFDPTGSGRKDHIGHTTFQDTGKNQWVLQRKRSFHCQQLADEGGRLEPPRTKPDHRL